MNRYVEHLKAYRDAEMEILSQLDLEAVSQLMMMLEMVRKNGKRVYICGNGGSYATASHFVCDFMKGVSMNQHVKYDFECLGDNSPLMMAIGNDISYDDIFVMPLQAKLKEGDMVIGISGSGNSENVVRAIAYAKEKGNPTAALVGYAGGKLLHLADHAIHVNINNMQIVEDVHMMLDHMMMYVLASLPENFSD